MSASVVAVVATYRRRPELTRLLDSLDGVSKVIVCDNEQNAEIESLVRGRNHEYLAPGTNLGCGGGLRLVEERALETGGEFTHLLVLDDDTVLFPGTIAGLLDAMERTGAAAVCPLILGPEGTTGWLPGLKDRQLHRVGKSPLTPSEYRRKLGVDAAEFTWTQGICLLIRREAVQQAGLHRGDFWVRGEDLDFSLRLSRNGKCLFIPGVEARHLPPPESRSGNPTASYLRHAALIQNMAYVGLRQPHGKPIRHTVLPAYLRFIADWGLRAVSDAALALWLGLVKGLPAGAAGGDHFRRRYEAIVELD